MPSRFTRLYINSWSAGLRLGVESQHGQTLGAARNGNSVIKRQVLSESREHQSKDHKRQRYRSYPSLSIVAVARVDQCRSPRSRRCLSIETQVGAVELNTSVVAFLNQPSLIGLGSLIIVGAVARGQGDCGPGVGISDLRMRWALLSSVRRNATPGLTVRHCPLCSI